MSHVSRNVGIPDCDVRQVPAFYDALEGNSCINFGCSVGHIPTRVAALEDVALGFSLGDPCCMLEAKVTSAPSHSRTASDAELAKLFGLLEQGLDEGGIGIGAGIAYTPGSDHREVFRLQQFCGRNQVSPLPRPASPYLFGVS